jgi:hypothetical protein
VLLISSLFFFVFGIIGVNFLKGLFYFCETSKISELTGFNEDKLDHKWDCINYGGEWLGYSFNFDDIENSFIEMVLIS